MSTAPDPQTRRSSPMNEGSRISARDAASADCEDVVDVIVRAEGQAGSIAARRVGGALDAGQQVGARLAEDGVEDRVAIGIRSAR